MPPLTLRPTFIHAPTQHVMIHCASRAFGAEMCGDALIKSVSAQPQVKCLRPDFNLLSPSLSGCWIDCATLRRLYCDNKVNKYIIIITINNRFFFLLMGQKLHQFALKKRRIRCENSMIVSVKEWIKVCKRHKTQKHIVITQILSSKLLVLLSFSCMSEKG